MSALASLANSDSPQIKLIQEWGLAFDKKNLDLIAKTLHKDYRHTTYPQSLGKPEKTREEWLEHIAGVIGLWTEQDPIIHSVTEVPGKVIVHFTNTAKTSIGVDMIREAILIVHIATDEDGSLKIRQIEDFIDSKSHLDFIQAVAAVKAKK